MEVQATYLNMAVVKCGGSRAKRKQNKLFPWQQITWLHSVQQVWIVLSVQLVSTVWWNFGVSTSLFQCDAHKNSEMETTACDCDIKTSRFQSLDTLETLVTTKMFNLNASVRENERDIYVDGFSSTDLYQQSLPGSYRIIFCCICLPHINVTNFTCCFFARDDLLNQ